MNAPTYMKMVYTLTYLDIIILCQKSYTRTDTHKQTHTHARTHILHTHTHKYDTRYTLYHINSLTYIRHTHKHTPSIKHTHTHTHTSTLTQTRTHTHTHTHVRTYFTHTHKYDICYTLYHIFFFTLHICCKYNIHMSHVFSACIHTHTHTHTHIQPLLAYIPPLFHYT